MPHCIMWQEEEVKRIKRTREDVGVDLYGVQQQLAKLQMNVEKTHDAFNESVQRRVEQEEDRLQVSNELEKRRRELQDQESRCKRTSAAVCQLIFIFSLQCTNFSPNWTS